MKIPEKPPGTPLVYNFVTVINDLISADRYDEFVELNHNKYPYWNKWKYIAKEWNYDAKQLWAAVKTYRVGSNIRIDNLPVFRLTSPTLVQEHLHACDINLSGGGYGDGIIPSADRQQYLISSLMEESIASSQLEGANTERKLAKDMLQNNRKPRDMSEQMIVNNYEAMKWIVENKSLPFTPENICKLHSIITQDTLQSKLDEGAFRNDDEVAVRDVQTGQVLHQPPPYKDLTALITSFCQFANDEVKQPFFIHPVSRGIILHFLLGYIHPFVDGNGRTARTIFYWYLIKKGYWLIEYMSVSRILLNSKAQYARAYLHTELDGNDLTYFVIYNLKSILKALDELKVYANRKAEEKKNVLKLLSTSPFNDRQIEIIREMLNDTNKHYSVYQIEQLFKVSNQTARNDLNKLVESGLMEERKSGKKILYLPAADLAQKMETVGYK